MAGHGGSGSVSPESDLYRSVLAERDTGNTRSPKTVPAREKADENTYYGLKAEVNYPQKLELYLFVGRQTAELQEKLLSQIKLSAEKMEWAQEAIKNQKPLS